MMQIKYIFIVSFIVVMLIFMGFTVAQEEENNLSEATESVEIITSNIEQSENNTVGNGVRGVIGDLAICITLLSGLGFFVKIVISYKERKTANKNLPRGITDSIWHSAELDFKQDKIVNAYKEVEIKRAIIGNKITISTIESPPCKPKFWSFFKKFDGNLTNKPKNQTESVKTAWIATGIVKTTSTLSLNWDGKIDGSIRYGSAFLKFIENNKAVGWWIGYASNKTESPQCGYWILSRNKSELEELAEFVLKETKPTDVKDLIENKEKIIKDRITLLDAEKLIKAPHDYFKSGIAIEKYKKTFHIYHLTTETTGKNNWKYHTIDFAEKSNEETLISDFITINAEGTSVPNRINARKIGEHFMMIIKQTEGNEPPAICIFPFAYRIEDTNFGFIFGTSWLKKPYQGKMIISITQIISISQSEEIEQGILSDSQSTFLEGLWKKRFTTKLLNFKNK